MPFHARVTNAIHRANGALSQLYSYNSYAHPRSEPNASIRNGARYAIDPLVQDIRHGVREGRYEGVSRWDANEALRAAELLRRATFDLSDRPSEGRPANVSLAQRHIRDAVELLNAARW